MENLKPAKSTDLNPTRHAFHILNATLKSANPQIKPRPTATAVEAWQNVLTGYQGYQCLMIWMGLQI